MSVEEKAKVVELIRLLLAAVEMVDRQEHAAARNMLDLTREKLALFEFGK